MIILSYVRTIFPSFYLFLAKICLQFLTALLKYYFHLIKFTMLSIHFIKFGQVYSHATITTINFQNIFTTPKSYLTPCQSISTAIPGNPDSFAFSRISYKENTQHAVFYIWLLSPSMFLRSIYVATCVNKLFLLVATIIPLFMYHVDLHIPRLSIYQFMDVLFLLFYYNE